MIILPAALVRTLRDPSPSEADFTPTRFCPAGNKAWFAVHILRFCSSDFPRHQFTQRFYAQLMHCYGMIAHFNHLGFWEEFFTSAAGKVEFLDQVTAWPGYGSPDHTWCDVERAVIRRLRAVDLLGLYRQRLRAEHDAAERAEFARLRAKWPSHLIGRKTANIGNVRWTRFRAHSLALLATRLMVARWGRTRTASTRGPRRVGSTTVSQRSQAIHPEQHGAGERDESRSRKLDTLRRARGMAGTGGH